jgi:ketosteroid isomerase-like protein
VGVIDRFYTAFAERDPEGMARCYAPDARFSDPVFPDLDGEQVRAMWRMLVTSGTDLHVTHSEVEEGATRGRCRWDAWYTFSRTGRPVHNIIRSEFVLRDGFIVEQRDRFDFWRWSRQALGPMGWLLGWTPWLRDRVRATAARSLAKTMGR